MISSTRQNKTKVVLDTNIVVSALLAKEGNPAKIFELLLQDEIENYTTPAIIAEIKKVFKREEITTRATETDINFILKHYLNKSVKVLAKEKIFAVEKDPEDDKFIECAVDAGADYIVSGDAHLNDIKKFRDIMILKPKKFLEEISKH